MQSIEFPIDFFVRLVVSNECRKKGPIDNVTAEKITSEYLTCLTYFLIAELCYRTCRNAMSTVVIWLDESEADALYALWMAAASAATTRLQTTNYRV